MKSSPSVRPGLLTRFRALTEARVRRLRILVAEDNTINQFVPRQLFRGFEVQLDIVGDGLEAVASASRHDYDVILMDVNMPEMDGLRATRHIRARGGALAVVPILAFTANAFPEDIAACHAAGMNRFVAKPVNKEALLSELLAALADPERAEESLDHTGA